MDPMQVQGAPAYQQFKALLPQSRVSQTYIKSLSDGSVHLRPELSAFVATLPLANRYVIVPETGDVLTNSNTGSSAV